MNNEYHMDDLVIDRFAAALKKRMKEMRDAGRGGWQDPAQCSIQSLQEGMRSNARAHDPIDTGNYAAMLFFRTSPPQRMQKPVVPEHPSTAGMPPEKEEAIAAARALSPWLAQAMHNPLISDKFKQAITGWFNTAMPRPELPCDIPQPEGWMCTRTPGHTGPCAAIQKEGM